MPLDLGALEIIQQLKVFSCLDPLGNDLQLKALGELDSGAGNSGIVGIGRNIPHKGLGNLQYVNSIRLKYSREEQPVLKSSIESLIPMAFNACSVSMVVSIALCDAGHTTGPDHWC